MKKRALWAAAGLLALSLGLWLTSRGSHQSAIPPSSSSANAASNFPVAEVSTIPSAQPPVPSSQSSPLLGETILRDYANTNFPPENDLTLMSRLMDNSLLLLKSAASRPLSANEDWADLLLGKNSAHERFLPDHHPALNSKGQLIDRWGTPLFFHALGGSRYEIRSAGPDRKLWTSDDLHRNADGTFRRGANLNPPALYDQWPASTPTGQTKQ